MPVIVEKQTRAAVTNDFRRIPVDFQDAWAAHHRDGAPDLYPRELRAEIDEGADRVYRHINNGVYRAGFSGSQDAYEEAYADLWEHMDWLEDHLSRHRFLVGEHITLADVYLYPTLVRFDPVYVSHFKASRNRIAQMPNLRGYLQELFQLPEFGDTTDSQEIKEHYYITHAEINPTGVVPVGPDMRWLIDAHERHLLPGSPFADGVTPPRPVHAGEEAKHPAPFQR